MDRMGDKLAHNLLKAIDQSKRPNLANLIYALGIRNVGTHLAGVLAKHFKSIDTLAGQTVEDLTRVHEIGPVVAQSLFNFFRNPDNVAVLKKMERGGVVFPLEEGEITDSPLAGKTFVLTGGMDAFTRDEARKVIEGLGGRVSSSVSRKTDFVVVGRDPGSKYDDARRLGLKILNEKDFREMVDF
jgi:DNA ligase (NAD+)